MRVLIVGNCGVGKTWLMKALIKEFKVEKRQKIGKFYFHSNDRVIVVGKYDGSTFEGSDRLSMSVITDLSAFLQLSVGKISIFEGDRFTNGRFIKEANPIIVKILGDGASGREKRGSAQTERHIKSINTRVSNINANFEVNNSMEAFNLIKNLMTNE